MVKKVCISHLLVLQQSLAHGSAEIQLFLQVCDLFLPVCWCCALRHRQICRPTQVFLPPGSAGTFPLTLLLLRGMTPCLTWGRTPVNLSTNLQTTEIENEV